MEEELRINLGHRRNSVLSEEPHTELGKWVCLLWECPWEPTYSLLGNVQSRPKCPVLQRNDTSRYHLSFIMWWINSGNWIPLFQSLIYISCIFNESLHGVEYWYRGQVYGEIISLVLINNIFMWSVPASLDLVTCTYTCIWLSSLLLICNIKGLHVCGLVNHLLLMGSHKLDTNSSGSHLFSRSSSF